MKPIRDYRAEVERLWEAARQAPPEECQRLMQLAGLYEGLGQANEALARTTWPPAARDDAVPALDLLSVPVTVRQTPWD